MIDLIQIEVIAGSGGNGVSSFRREKFVPYGGPDGGDGGKGGDVVVVATDRVTTLAHLRRRKIIRAQPGSSGGPSRRHGRDGEDSVLEVPAGTIISREGSDQVWDLSSSASRVVVVAGGSGGRGNARFATSVRQAPNFAERGLPGQAGHLTLELKLLADVGLVGLPNAGKSTLLRSISRATPDVGSFPFTTLEPVLGVVDLGMEAFVVADLPGLIEGAHEGIGLGIEFLRHVERTRVLVHVVDAAAANPIADYNTIRTELGQYGHGLAEKPELVALNKMDSAEARASAAALRADLQLRGVGDMLDLSGATGDGTQALIKGLQKLLQDYQPVINTGEAASVPVLRPRAEDRLDITTEDGVFVVHGSKAEQHAARLAEGGDEALDELQERLRRMGLAKALRRAGASPGDDLRVGKVTLQWQG